MRMCCFRIPGVLTVALAVALLAAPARAADLNTLLPSDTEVIVSLNVKQLLASPLFRKYAADQVKAELKKNEQAQKVFEALGFDPLRDIDAIIASGGELELDSNRGLIIIRGRFDPAKIQALAEGVAQKQGDNLKIHRLGDVRLYEINYPEAGAKRNTETLFVNVLDGTTVIASRSKDSVVDTLDRQAGRKKAAGKKDLLDLLAKADRKQSMSFVISNRILAKIPVGDDQQLKQLLGQAQNLVGGFTVTDEVKAEFVLGAKNADDAGALSKMLAAKLNQLKLFVGFVVNANQEWAPLQDIVSTFKVSCQGTDVTIQGLADKDMIQKTSEAVGKLLKKAQ
jgi:hypothetical protein